MHLNKKKMRKVIAKACTMQVTQITVSLRCGITAQKERIQDVVAHKKELARHLQLYNRANIILIF